MEIDLDTPIEKTARMAEKQRAALEKLKIKTVRDALFYLPHRYLSSGEIKKISDLKQNDNATVYGKIVKTKTGKTFRTNIPISEMVIEDESGRIKAMWFHQPYLAKMLGEGDIVELSGIVNKDKKERPSMINPKIEKSERLNFATKGTLFETKDLQLEPIYPETQGINSNWIKYYLRKLIKMGVLQKIKDPIPKNILKKYNLPGLSTALLFIHAPRNERDAAAARKRLAFDEIFFIQLSRQRERQQYKNKRSYKIETSDEKIENFIKNFEFQYTNGQKNALKQIIKDLREGKPMRRLLEGDVGSGKTAVAAAAAFAVINTKPENQNFGFLQVAYMAPTEILSKQHFKSFIKYFEKTNINIALITGKECYKFPSKTDQTAPTRIPKSRLAKWVENGEIQIVIGTHALLANSIKFKHLALVIIDEQHRFGINQRGKLANKRDGIESAPHLLSMTATPIPRTLALTIYGDLDLSLVDEMPPGRQEIETTIVTPSRRADIYDKIKTEIISGRQAYIICPRIKEPDPNQKNKMNLRSVTEEAARLKKTVFLNFTIDIVHSKMTPKEKDAAMKRFSTGKTNILIATSVVEVGVNVPNATIMLIEGAERFGLAQLHQLRGRIWRSNFKPYCFAITSSRSEKTLERLGALKNAKNGFELSELDLQQRGSGELSGQKQWGISDLGMEAIKNIKMIEAARKEAADIVMKDYNLENFPLLKEGLALNKYMHLE